MLMAFGMFGALAGILLYSKLRLATSLPRSAYAVPEGEGLGGTPEGTEASREGVEQDADPDSEAVDRPEADQDRVEMPARPTDG
ncbi:MAG: hypothetical protein DHS20C14_10600 [Phycisphaeraceae bacterium]|nr:MAG: hypothetical protein DHS20C14_10600 [Phycisphaeraceae bacterium]